jgi:hypothetical protein
MSNKVLVADEVEPALEHDSGQNRRLKATTRHPTDVSGLGHNLSIDLSEVDHDIAVIDESGSRHLVFLVDLHRNRALQPWPCWSVFTEGRSMTWSVRILRTWMKRLPSSC